METDCQQKDNGNAYNMLPETQMTSSFNQLLHHPPKFDIMGQMKKQVNLGVNRYNILAEKDNIQIPWSNNLNQKPQSPMTQTKLFERRKKERIPDISYDLDKDGYVGEKDFVLAKRYDVDMDGKLNEQEKKAAYEGIANNVENNYVWNLDKQGGNRPFRILQKRGKIIDAEDFLPLRDTYPEHPISKIEPKNDIRTLNELKEYRQKEMKSDINKKTKKWEKINSQSLPSEAVAIESKNKPLISSMQELKQLQHREARIKAGLLEFEKDIKITNKDPTLKYVQNPVHKTARDFQAELHQENMKQLKKLNANDYLNDIERLNRREDEVFAKLYSNEDRMTFRKIQEARKKELLDFNFKTFAQQPIGVHGQELPKFSEDEKMKEFWKYKEGYCENPKMNSYIEFNENIKYWKKPEDMILCEHRDQTPQPDDFKKNHVWNRPEIKEDKLIIKVNHVNFYKDFDPSVRRPLDMEKSSKNHIYRWSTLSAQFAPQKFRKGRLFDSLPQEIVEEKNEMIDQFEKQFNAR